MADLRCATVQEAVSAAADGVDVDVDRGHVESCASCSTFAAGVRSLRAGLRFDVLDDAPDVAPAVLARVATPKRRSLLPVAAAAAVGVIAGVAFA